METTQSVSHPYPNPSLECHREKAGTELQGDIARSVP